MAGASGSAIAWRRYERKYLISEVQAAELRRRCRAILPPDRHAGGGAYSVLSVYLDSPKRDLLRHTLEKRSHRYKLRVRTYRTGRELPAAPVFVEIKKKLNGISHKLRAGAVVRGLDELLEATPDAWVQPAQLDEAEGATATEFALLSSTLAAAPVIAIQYAREAFESECGDVRITFDRQVQYSVVGAGWHPAWASWWPVFREPRVVLEVKFMIACPFWLAGLVQRGELPRKGVSKYVVCSRAMLAREAPCRPVRVL